MRERRKCFGTKEYSEKSWICSKGCPDYIRCGEERTRNLEKRKLEILEGEKKYDKKDNNIQMAQKLD